jgi:hypothetical protein
LLFYQLHLFDLQLLLFFPSSFTKSRLSKLLP